MEGPRALGRRLSLEEFLVWDSGDDARYELIDGVVRMMAPATEPHGTLAMNLGAALRPRLRSPCRVVAEAAVARPGARDRCFHADVVVTCAPPERGRILVRDPVLVAEVLAPSTESTDRRIKVPDYRAVPSVREILLIDQDRAFVECLRRLDGDRWLTVLAIGREATLTLDSVGLDLRLDDLYRDLDLPEPDAADAGTKV